MSNVIHASQLGIPPNGNITAAINTALASMAPSSQVLVDFDETPFEITDISVPPGQAVTFCNGIITVSGSGSRGIQRVTTDASTPAKYSVIFDNINFIRSSPGGACIFSNLAWQDESGGIVINSNCTFTLSNGAVGVRLGRCYGNSIKGRYKMDATSIALLADSTQSVPGDAYPSCPFETIIDDAFFWGGTAFTQEFQTTSIWNSFEGFTFGPGCRFYSSQFKATKYNTVKLIGCHGASIQAIFDSGINTQITGGYYDRNTANQKILQFRTTLRDMQGITISGGAIFSAQGSVGVIIWLSDAGSAPSKQITNVNFGSMYMIGGINDATNSIRGIYFDHALCRNVNIDGGLNFQNMYACLSFNKPINRSTIKSFEARDVSWYAESVATGYGPISGGGYCYNRFDGIYRVYESIEIIVPTYIATSANEVISSQNLPHPAMMRPPVVTVGAYTNPFGSNFTFQTLSYRNSITIYLYKSPAAPGNMRGGQSAPLILDASQYLAPL